MDKVAGGLEATDLGPLLALQGLAIQSVVPAREQQVLVRNAESQTPRQTYWISISIFTRFPDGLHSQ